MYICFIYYILHDTRTVAQTQMTGLVTVSSTLVRPNNTHARPPRTEHT